MCHIPLVYSLLLLAPVAPTFVYPSVGLALIPRPPIYVQVSHWDHLFTIPLTYTPITENAESIARFRTQSSALYNITASIRKTTCDVERHDANPPMVEEACALLRAMEISLTEKLTLLMTYAAECASLENRMIRRFSSLHSPPLRSRRSPLVDDTSSPALPPAPSIVNVHAGAHYYAAGSVINQKPVDIPSTVLTGPSPPIPDPEVEHTILKPNFTRRVSRLQEHPTYLSLLQKNRVREFVSDVQSLCKVYPLFPDIPRLIAEGRDMILRAPHPVRDDFCREHNDATLCPEQRFKRSPGQKCWILCWRFSLATLVWGAADINDIANLQSEVSINREAIKAVNNKMDILAAKTISATADLLRNVTVQFDQALQKVNTNLASIYEWQNTTQAMLNDLVDTLRATRLIAALQLHMIRVLSALDDLDTIIGHYAAGINHYESLLQAIIQKSVPQLFYKLADPDFVIENIKANLPDDLGLPPSPNNYRLFESIPTTCLVTATNMTFVFHIPLIRVDDIPELWSVKTIPIILGSMWAKLRTSYDAVLLYKSRKQWAGIDSADLKWCEADALHVCKIAQFLRDYPGEDCVMNYIADRTYEGNHCEVRITERMGSKEINIIPLELNHWLVSVGHQIRHSTQLCSSSGTSIVSRVEVKIPPVILIKVLPKCRVEIGNVSFIPASFGRSQGNTKLGHDVNLSALTDNVLGVVPWGAEINDTQYRKFDLNLTFIPITPISLPVIQDVLADEDVIAASSHVKHILSHQASWEGGGSWISQVSSSTMNAFTIIGICTVVICVILCGCQIAQFFRKVNPTAVAAGATMSMLPPPVYGAPLNSTGYSPPTIVETSWIHLQSETLLHLLVMATFMICCHWFMVKFHRRQMRRVLTLLRAVPRNKAASHIPGESNFNAVFLIQIYNSSKPLLSDTRYTDSTYQLIEIQLCTIPEPPSSWCVTLHTGQPQVTKDTGTHWMSKHIEFQLEWGSLCLRTIKNLLSSACSDLPTRVKIPMWALREQMTDETPAGWNRIRFEGICKLYVSDAHNSVCLYSSGEEPEGNIRIKRQYGEEFLAAMH